MPSSRRVDPRPPLRAFSPCLPLGLGLLLALSALAGGAGCARSPAGRAGAAGASRLEVRDARAVLYPATGAVYLTVVNSGAESDRLVRVETSAARSAETHESVEDGDVMRMVPRPDGFEIPAGGSLALAPGGKHVMLVDLAPRAPGARAIPLILHFARAGTIGVEARLVAPGEEGANR